GFANYELESNPGSRFAKRKAALVQQAPRTYSLHELARQRKPGVLLRCASIVSEKAAFLHDRDAATCLAFPESDVGEAVRRTVSQSILSDPALANRLGLSASYPQLISA